MIEHNFAVCKIIVSFENVKKEQAYFYQLPGYDKFLWFFMLCTDYSYLQSHHCLNQSKLNA